MINIEMKVARIMLLACIITSVSCHEQPARRQQSDTNRSIAVTADPLTIEMFKPYLTKQHNINDVMRAFPEPYFFNAGSAFTWATYKLSDGTILRVGQHGEASAMLRNAEGAVIQRFSFGSWTETRFPVIGSAGSPVDISPARLQKAETPPAITAASLFENWDGTLVTREGTVRTDLRPKAGVLLHRYLYMTVGGHFRPTGTFVCYAPDKGVFLLFGDCGMNHAELLAGPYAGDPRKVLLYAMRDSKQDAPPDADKAMKQIRAGKPKAIPFQPIPAKSIAYVDGLSVTVYFVADDAVLRLVIPLRKTRIKGNSVVAVASSKGEASLFRGKDAWRSILPRGAAPLPAPSIKRESAVSGKFTCIDIPAQKTWPYHGKTKITVKDMQLMLPSGRVTADGPLTFILRPFPPAAAVPPNGAAAVGANKAAAKGIQPAISLCLSLSANSGQVVFVNGGTQSYSLYRDALSLSASGKIQRISPHPAIFPRERPVTLTPGATITWQLLVKENNIYPYSVARGGFRLLEKEHKIKAVYQERSLGRLESNTVTYKTE